MRKLFKFLLISALILAAVPVAFILFVMGMAALGVVVGIGAAILGLMFSVLKVALMILVPVALIYFVAKVLMSPERTY